MNLGQRQIPYNLTYMWNLNLKTDKHTPRCRQQTGGCQSQGHEMTEGGKKVQVSSCKGNKSWGCKVQHDDYR